ncbi:hypothetical protein DIU31_016315 [Mucilaginibacter rubeus]|uniref:Uncharacterized protein n=1 Tax=Mucilaginibacter rubeus TaxID=2027860 RepID=A0AAE6JGI7_9SPHI|nr:MULTISPECIES: hypothetical protein [Mucilaginibacter]QEM05003.1 hypothetical protein DIU31_016315 [Mucilaginibacter rubeus]QEM17597.1 hypothetical protein DIU38_016480 [Mucilaginibacter gossypii]QTE45882.1 hypothetical protein J3L19_11205 [Mucilaginibacter rubeus]QTE52479.1 hypothetical protein J3L21_11175 [Mucilaginibacter rubeus]QTE57568.1 hypothetical protein J3L23_02850 [Mucilaginibacter rubeus]
MIPYDSILQLVNGKVYSLHHIWSSFHIHQPDYEAIRFYGVSPADRQVIVVQTDGQNVIYKDLPETPIDELDTGKDIETNLGRIIGGNFEKETCDAYITEVPLEDVLDAFCQMQDYIATSSGLWATDRPDLFKGKPNAEFLFHLQFKQKP